MKSLILGILFLIHFKMSAIIIVVHGTFAAEASWWKSGGDFYQALEYEANKLNEKIHSFNWAGALNNIARIRAAKELSEFILSLENEKIILIGHSFGGNVINLASKLLYHYENTPAFSSCADIAEFVQAYRDLEKIRNKKCCKHLIEMVYLLGTPIDPQQFYPNMYVIKYLCNLYSPHDNVQSIGGFYYKTFKNLEQSANFEVIIRDPKVPKGYPNHYQMHHPIIAQSILYIPFNFKEQKIGGFELFEWKENGIIEFSLDQFPNYIVNKKPENPIMEKDTESSSLPLWS